MRGRRPLDRTSMSTLASLLVRDRVVPVRRIEEAIERQVVSGLSLATVLAESQAAPENVLAAYVAAVLELPPLPRQALASPPGEVLQLLTAEQVATFRIVPVARLQEGLAVAVDRAPTPEETQRWADALGEPPIPCLVLEPRLAEAMERLYGVEAPRKLARIARRLDGAPSGEIPEVAPPEATRLDLRRRRRISLPGRSGRPSLEPEPPPTSGSTQRFGSLPEEPADRAPAPPPPSPPSEPASADAPQPAAPRPLPVAEALERLEHASAREDVVETLWRVAAGVLRRMALFTVRGPHGVVRRVWPGSALPQDATVPLRGALEAARASGAPVLRPRPEPEDAVLLAALGERLDAPILVVPISLRGRTVLLLGGDREGERFGLPDTAELLAIVPRVAEAFERLIRARKLRAFQSPSSVRREAALGTRRPILPDKEPSPARSGPWRPPHRLVIPRRATVLGMSPAPAERPSSQPPPRAEPPPPSAGPADPSEHTASRPASFDRLGVPRTPPPPPLPRQVDPGVGLYSVRAARSDSLPPPRPSHTSRPPGPRSAPPTSPVHTPHEQPSTPPRSLRDEGRRVIVDMGMHIPALVEDLLRSAPDEQHPALQRLTEMGEAALPALVEAFPGPLWFDRRHPHRRTPRSEDISPIARALVAFGRRAVPYLLGLLAAPSADHRYYALLVARDLPDRRLVEPMGRLLLDEDAGIRALAAETLHRLVRYQEEMERVLVSLRRLASDRRRDVQERVLALRALGALRDTGAMEALLEAIESRDEQVAQAAQDALVSLTRQDFGRSARRWRAWVERNRTRHRIEWLIDALTHPEEALRREAGRELGRLTRQYLGFHPALPKRDREVCQRKYRSWWEREGRHRFLSTP